MELEQLIEPRAVQKAMKCSLSKIYKMAHDGTLPSVRIPQISDRGRERYMIRFRAKDVQELIERSYTRGRS